MNNENFMLWFDDLVYGLANQPYLGNMGAPVVTTPDMTSILNDYISLRNNNFNDYVFLRDDSFNIGEQRKAKIESFTESQRIDELEKRIKELEEIIKNK